MKKIANQLQVSLRSFFLLFLIQIAFFFSIAFGWGNNAQAIAAPTLTPEATKYQVDQTPTTLNDNSDKTTNSGKSAVENIKEKLNLDEPIPEDTKKFFRQVQGKEDISNDNHPELNY